MKLFRLSMAFSFLIITMSLKAQTSGFLIGIDASYNLNSIINQNNLGQNLMDYDKFEMAQLRVMPGAHVGYKFDHRHQVRVGFMYFKGGQDYKDNYSFGKLRKTVEFSQLAIPITYRFTTGHNVSDNSGIKFYVDAGPMFSFMQNGDIQYQVNDGNSDFISFYTIGGNANAQFLRDQKLSDKEASDPATFYETTDVLAHLGLGIQAYLGQHIMLSFGVNGMISFADINKEEWRIDNVDGEYLPSRNTGAGFSLSLSYLF